MPSSSPESAIHGLGEVGPVGRGLGAQGAKVIWPGADVIKIVSRISQEVDKVVEEWETRIECCEVHVLAAIFPVPSLNESSVRQIKLSEQSGHLGFDSQSHM